MYFHYFVIISLWKGQGPLFKQTWITIQGGFVSSLVEFGPVVLEKKIFKFCLCIFPILWLPPLGKGLGPSFWINLNPLHSRMHCAKFGWNWWFWRRRWKCEKFTTTTPTMKTDNRQILIRKAHLSLRLRWAKSGYFETNFSL